MPMKTHAVFILGILCLTVMSVFAQPPVPPYTGGLVYGLPWLTDLPPVRSNQPTEISSAYAYLDLAMRLSPAGSTNRFLTNLGWGDTAKFIADYLYRVDNDNPVFFQQWESQRAHPNPYLSNPARSRVLFTDRVAATSGDTDRTWMLLSSDIISHIHVTDTVMHSGLGGRFPDFVVVNAQIIDQIKGKFKPSCPLLYSNKKGNKPQSIPYDSTFADSVGLAEGTIGGKCIQFNYALGWSRRAIKQGVDYYDNDDSGPDNLLYDPTNGAWIKPGQDYVVFLRFIGLSGDSARQYVTVWPVTGFGTCAGMYPVTSTVYDPNDDFGIGASAGLAPVAWKNALRARISRLVNP